MAYLLIGYDVEHRDPEVTRPFLTRMREIHEALNIPATLFIVGRTLEHSPEAFQALVGHPLFDLQQHTYSHMLLKTICIQNDKGTQIVRGGTPDQIREEIQKTNRLMHEVLGVECTGFTGPWNYYRGLSDRPDLLEILWEEGIRWMRCAGRNERDWQPVPFDWQPYWYEPQGFPDMLEFPIQGWQDCILRQNLGYDNLNGYLDRVRQDVDTVAARNLIWNYVQHDWSSIREDPAMWLTEHFFRYALERGLQFDTYHNVYTSLAAARTPAVQATA